MPADLSPLSMRVPHRGAWGLTAVVALLTILPAPEHRAPAGSVAELPADHPGKIDSPSATTVVQGQLFLSRVGRVLEDGVVVLNGDRVVCSGPPEACTWPEETPVHHFPESTILPGLIDLHVHARVHYVGAFVPAGVTTIRDMNNTFSDLEAMSSVDPGPRLLASGPLLDGPDGRFVGSSAGHPDRNSMEKLMPIVVETPEEAESAVAALADRDVAQVKLYERLAPDVFAAAVQAAGERDMPVAVDLGLAFTGGLGGAAVDIVQAASAGVSTIEHLSGLALAYQRRGADPFSPELDREILSGIAADLLEEDVTFVPTAATILRVAGQELSSVEGLPGIDEMRVLLEPSWDQMESYAARSAEAVNADRRLAGALFELLLDGDARIGAGSDLPAAPGMYPGWALHRELEALVKLGMSPTAALQSATSTAAEVVGRDDLGHLGAGARGDLVVVAGDPTSDIQHTRRIRAVWSRGEPVELESAWAQAVKSLDPSDSE